MRRKRERKSYTSVRLFGAASRIDVSGNSSWISLPVPKFSSASSRERSKTRVGSGGSTIKASLASISFVKLPRRVSPVVLFHGVNPTSVFPGAQSPGSLSVPRLPCRAYVHTTLRLQDKQIENRFPGSFGIIAVAPRRPGDFM